MALYVSAQLHVDEPPCEPFTTDEPAHEVTARFSTPGRSLLLRADPQTRTEDVLLLRSAGFLVQFCPLVGTGGLRFNAAYSGSASHTLFSTTGAYTFDQFATAPAFVLAAQPDAGEMPEVGFTLVFYRLQSQKPAVDASDETLSTKVDSMEGTSSYEICRLDLLWDRRTQALPCTIAYTRAPGYPAIFMGARGLPTEVVIKRRTEEVGRFSVLLSLSSTPAPAGKQCAPVPAPTPWKQAARRANDALWRDSNQQWMALDTGRFRSYRPVAVPSSLMLPPTGMSIYPTPVQMARARWPGFLRFMENLLLIGGLCAGARMNAPEWASGRRRFVAGVAALAAHNSTRRLPTDTAVALEAVSIALTLTCVPIMVYVLETFREHYASIINVSGDCEDYAHYVACFLYRLVVEVPESYVAASQPCLALRWLLRSTYLPLQVYYRTSVALRAGVITEKSQTGGCAHQDAVLWPLEHALRVGMLTDDARLQLWRPTELEQAALGVHVAHAARPAALARMPPVDCEGTGRNSGIITPLLHSFQYTRKMLHALKKRDRRLSRIARKFNELLYVRNPNALLAAQPFRYREDDFKLNITYIQSTQIAGVREPLAGALLADGVVGVRFSHVVEDFVEHTRAISFQSLAPDLELEQLQHHVASCMIPVDIPTLRAGAWRPRPKSATLHTLAAVTSIPHYVPHMLTDTPQTLPLAALVVPERNLLFVLRSTPAVWGFVNLSDTKWAPAAAQGLSGALLYIY